MERKLNRDPQQKLHTPTEDSGERLCAAGKCRAWLEMLLLGLGFETGYI